MLYKNRKKFSKTQKKIGSFFSKLPFSANFYTLLSLVFALLGVFSIIIKNIPLSIAFYAIAFFLDVIDGAVARAKKQASPLGAFYDTITDKYVEFFFILGILFLPAPSFFLSKNQWLALYGSSFLLSGYIKAASVEKKVLNKELKGGGILERPERVISLFLLLILYFFNPAYISIFLAILFVLAQITAFQRFLIVSKAVSKK